MKPLRRHIPPTIFCIWVCSCLRPKYLLPTKRKQQKSWQPVRRIKTTRTYTFCSHSTIGLGSEYIANNIIQYSQSFEWKCAKIAFIAINISSLHILHQKPHRYEHSCHIVVLSALDQLLVMSSFLCQNYRSAINRKFHIIFRMRVSM